MQAGRHGRDVWRVTNHELAVDRLRGQLLSFVAALQQLGRRVQVLGGGAPVADEHPTSPNVSNLPSEGGIGPGRSAHPVPQTALLIADEASGAKVHRSPPGSAQLAVDGSPDEWMRELHLAGGRDLADKPRRSRLVQGLESVLQARDIGCQMHRAPSPEDAGGSEEALSRSAACRHARDDGQGEFPRSGKGSVAVLERTDGQLLNERAGVQRVATSVGMEAGCTPVGQRDAAHPSAERHELVRGEAAQGQAEGVTPSEQAHQALRKLRFDEVAQDEQREEVVSRQPA